MSLEMKHPEDVATEARRLLAEIVESQGKTLDAILDRLERIELNQLQPPAPQTSLGFAVQATAANRAIVEEDRLLSQSGEG